MVTWALLACGTRLDVRNPTCEHPVVSYTGGPHHYVLEGGGRGAFDVPLVHGPPGRVTGAVDLQTGEFAYEVNREAGPFADASVTEGEGTLFPDGDLDIRYRLDEHQDTRTVRRIRLGCEENIRFESAGNLSYETREYRPDGYAWTRTHGYRGASMNAVGFVETSGSYALEGRLQDGRFDLDYTESFDGEEVVRVFDDFVGLERSVGSWTASPSGFDVEVAIDSPWRGTTQWSYALDVRGDGAGTIVTSEAVCDLTFGAFACESSCGPCELPVPLPISSEGPSLP